MNAKKILLIFIIGIFSLNVIFAGITSKTFLIKGDLEITPDLEFACKDGVGLITFSDKIENDIAYFAGQTTDYQYKCKLEISLQGASNRLYEKDNLSAQGIKNGLKEGINVTYNNITEITENLTFVITIKSTDGGANYTKTLLSTNVLVPNPNAENLNITSDFLGNNSSSLVCNAINLRKVAVIEGSLKRCAFSPDDGSYSWIAIGGGSGITGVTVSNMLSNLDTNIFYRIAMNHDVQKISLRNIKGYMLEDQTITINKLHNDLRTLLGEKIEDPNVNLDDDTDDYIRIKGNDDEWYYIKLYPADSFISATNFRDLCPTTSSNKVPIQSYRIDPSTISVSPLGVQPAMFYPKTHAIQYVPGNDYFTIISAGSAVEFPVTVTGYDDQGRLRKYTSVYSYLPYNHFKCSAHDPDEIEHAFNDVIN